MKPDQTTNFRSLVDFQVHVKSKISNASSQNRLTFSLEILRWTIIPRLELGSRQTHTGISGQKMDISPRILYCMPMYAEITQQAHISTLCSSTHVTFEQSVLNWSRWHILMPFHVCVYLNQISATHTHTHTHIHVCIYM